MVVVENIAGGRFIRVLVSRFEELNLYGYVQANKIEAKESKSAREEYLNKFNAWVYRERPRIKILDIEFETS